MADEARELLKRLVAAKSIEDWASAREAATVFLDLVPVAPVAEIRVSQPVKRDDGPPRLFIAIEGGVFMVEGHWHKPLGSVVENQEGK